MKFFKTLKSYDFKHKKIYDFFKALKFYYFSKILMFGNA